MHIREMHKIGPCCRERTLPLLEKGPLAELGVLMGGISELRGQYYMSRSNPWFAVLLGTLAGEGQFQTTTGTRRLIPGDVLAAPTGVPYRYDTLRNKRWRIVWFHLLPQPWMPQGDAVRITPSSGLPAMVAEMEDLLREAAAPMYLCAQARRAKEAYLDVMIQRLFRQGQPAAPGHYEVILDQLRLRVTENLARSWTLADLAALAGFSAGHLNRICRRHYGRPAIKQLARWRMENAASILRRGDLKIDAIANLCGYVNAFAFSVAFKRQFGCPPSRFKAACL